MSTGAEATRLADGYSDDPAKRWLQWGPYLSERQWGTVREDYSQGGNAWDYFPHDHARSRAYRWGEDGLAGLSDDKQRLCFALALWNQRDPIIKERLFGLTNGEGNHGEDVKEYYFFLDNTPTHSWMTWLYKYPQRAYPYADLVAENARRKQADPHAFEYELMDTGVFEGDRYFDVSVSYAKAGPNDICVRITVTNRGPDAAPLDVLPTLCFRNQWSWTTDAQRPKLLGAAAGGVATIHAIPAGSDTGSEMMLYCQGPDELLFVENDTNTARLWSSPNSPRYPKDGINDYIVSRSDTVNRALQGTKASARWTLTVAAGATQTLQLRLTSALNLTDPFGAGFDATFQARQTEADAWWDSITPAGLSADRRAILRQAYAGMLWSKQYYYYVVSEWLEGDPAYAPPPAGRARNNKWQHFYASNILTMPDTWEYPWFASWDLCFQSTVFARIDVRFAKNQLLVLAREYYMSPDGAIPAYEWAFDDVNPPLHAWAALRIFETEIEMHGGTGDYDFLDAIFRYCLMYFTWWANRKDSEDNDLFSGGFLGLDNISIIDRSHLDQLAAQVQAPVELSQSDGTSWMGMFSLNLMDMAIRLSQAGRPEYERLADKFFQHFVFIADAINGVQQHTTQDVKIWDESDGFYYDVLRVGTPDRAQYLQVKLRSLVGVIALFPCLIVDLDQVSDKLAAGLNARIAWFAKRHPELLDQAMVSTNGTGHRQLLSFVQPERLKRILQHVLDEAQLLGPHGIRGLSRAHLNPPYQLAVNGTTLTEQYEPAESAEGLFGGNSNWRGPVWFPINFLLIETLARYHRFVGEDFKVEFPSGSGQQMTLRQVADALSDRLIGIFERDQNGNRPVYGGNQTFQKDPRWGDHLLFFEYYHGDNGAGLGASHQTGWTGLVTELLRGVQG